jgi:phage repressor protein C with HTH and peptisase S24 domain
MNIGEMIDSIGKSRSTWNDWVKYNRIPPGDLCVKIAEVLGTTVEYLVTGTELPLSDETEPKPIQLPNGKTVNGNGEEPTMLVPIAPQKISAGSGERFLPPSSYIGYVRVIERMSRGIGRDNLIAAMVKGDSMTGVQIFDGDIVIFAQGHVSENGIYVVSLRGDVLVKRIEFNPIRNQVSIISENKNYSPIITVADDENFKILGKVVGWIHVHPY